jgi:imidazolonepropionase-like amidohydrolase
MGWCRDPLPRLPRVAPEVAKALLAEARRLGMRASVHAPQGADARAAVADGATALAHGVLEPLDAKTIAAMKRRPVFYIPTMDIFEFLADTRAFVDAVLADPAALAIGREKVARYRARAYSDGYAARYPNFESLRRRLPELYRNLRRLREAGVPVALGTDMWAFPGLAVSIELDLYAKAGVPPLEALRMATQTAARSLGADKDRGTLETGKRADFLVLAADPLADLKNVRRIDAVYKAGVRHAPAGARANR